MKTRRIAVEKQRVAHRYWRRCSQSQSSNAPTLFPIGVVAFRTAYADPSVYYTRRWLEQAMVRFCKAADVPYVCPHALKGTAATLLAQTGELADRIADHLSHEESSTTSRHYVAPGAIEQAQASRAFAVIAGGKAGISSTISSTRGKNDRISTGGSSQNRTENLTRMRVPSTRN